MPQNDTCACNSNTVLWHLFAEWLFNRYVLTFFYLLLMINIFIAIALVADIFVSSIQTITSQTKRVKCFNHQIGKYQVICSKIWNQTVANLSLMAFGSSTPEILLATIEIVGNNFQPDKLGPGTIVGASMFNTFVITGFCVIAVQGQSKSIKNVQVFWLSTFFSLMAYIWLYLILQVITPNQVTIFEATATVLMFPLMILSGYAVDKHFSTPLSDQEHKNKDKLQDNNNRSTIINSPSTVITSFEAAPTIANQLEESVVELPVKSIRCLRKASQVIIPVVRRGLSKTVFFQIVTVSQNAQENIDFVPTNTTVTIPETQMSIGVPIIILPNDSHHAVSFLVYLKVKQDQTESVVIGNNCIQINLLSDVNRDQAQFSSKLVHCKNSILSVTICRESYQQETPIKYRWKMIDIITTSHHEYDPIEGEVIFNNLDKIKHVDIAVLNNSYNLKEYFYIILIDSQSNTQIDSCKVVRGQLDTERAVTLSGRLVQAVELEPDSGLTGYVLHVFSLFWKVLFALIPSTQIAGGWVTFACSILIIALLTAIMGDLAHLFGCHLAISAHLTGLTLVAVGTSLPDLFASKLAAQREMYADDAIGNINGSNAFNVFLGLGFPWLCAAVYHQSKGSVFRVSELTDLTFSVILFAIFSLIQLLVLVLRRRLECFGKAELGGPRRYALLTCLLFVVLWLLYITLALIH